MTTRTDHQPTTHSSHTRLEQHIETARQQGAAHRPRILIVEDHAETALLIQYTLRQHYCTDVVHTADEALQKAAATTYDGFLIDISLRSKRNGIDVLEALRDEAPYGQTPMVAVTAHALPGDRQRFLDAGFDDYLGKPFATDDLRAVLRRHVKPRRTPRPAALNNASAEQ